MPYIPERDESGKPVRLWWVPALAPVSCACGREATSARFTGEPECEECRRARLGYYFAGRDAGCPWCGGRGCLACGQAREGKGDESAPR